MLHVIFSPMCVSESDWMGQAEITLHLINDSTAEEKGVTTTNVTLLHKETELTFLGDMCGVNYLGKIESWFFKMQVFCACL